ncbi:MAG: SAM-dependent methyltransferase [Bacteriovoracaceae bacterium]
MSGKLILVPTPIHESLPLEPVAQSMLLENALDEKTIIAVEEHKVGRQRWLKWGLPRESIEHFVLFNEHTSLKEIPELLKKLKAGFNIYLMSDGGLPAFCDPGQKLIESCHKQGIKVTSTPFPNSIALAVSLSGFPHDTFYFAGFIPLKSPEREESLKRLAQSPEMSILMDTPYRLSKILSELQEQLSPHREIFLASDLNSPEELLLRGPVQTIINSLKPSEKREFILLIAPQKRP